MNKQPIPIGMRYRDIADFPAMESLLTFVADPANGMLASYEEAGRLVEEVRLLRAEFDQLSETEPDQKVVATIREVKAAVFTLVETQVDGLIAYDYAEHALTPDTHESEDDHCSLVFSTNTGGRELWFGYESFDPFKSYQQEPVEIPTGKKALFLIHYTSLQRHPNNIPVIIGYRGQITSAAFLNLSVKPFGNLYIDVKDPDSGSSVPFLVDIIDLTSGKRIIPENALDIARQMDPSAERSFPFIYPYAQNFPGEPKSRFYIVPRRIEQMLPPGRYRISVRRGIEHEIASEEVLVKEGNITDVTFELQRWADMRSTGWISGEGHMHGRVLSGTDADSLLTWAIAADVHITNVLLMGNYTQTWFDQRGFGKEYRVEKDGYHLIPGQEDPRGWGGHVVGQNIDTLVRSQDDYLSYQEVYDQIHQQGGIVGGAHILSKEIIQGDRLAALDMPYGRLDYYEILQVGELDTDIYFDCLDLGMKMSPGSGTDIPWHGSIGEGRMYVYTGSPEPDPDQWFEGLKDGHVFITNSAMIDFSTSTGAIPGDTVICQDEEDSITFSVHVTSRGDGQYIKEVQLIAHSAVIYDAPGLDEATDLSFEVTLPVRDGFWALVKVTTTDGGAALSAPIYIQRGGQRFWNRERVGEIVDRYSRMLEGFIKEIQSDCDWYETYGEAGPDLYRRARGAQGTQFIKEIQETIEAYEALASDLDSL